MSGSSDEHPKDIRSSGDTLIICDLVSRHPDKCGGVDERINIVIYRTHPRQSGASQQQYSRPLPIS